MQAALVKLNIKFQIQVQTQSRSQNVLRKVFRSFTLAACVQAAKKEREAEDTGGPSEKRDGTQSPEAEEVIFAQNSSFGLF